MTTIITTPVLHRSALHVDPRHPAIAGALADAHWMHRNIMSAWAGYSETHDFFTGTATGHPNHRESLGVLYAVSKPRPDGTLIIITQAHQPPDWGRAAEQAERIASELAKRWGKPDPGRYRWTDAFLNAPVDSIRSIEEAGTQIVFELRGAPSKKRGAVRRNITEPHQADNWAYRRLSEAGLSLHTGPGRDTPTLTSGHPLLLRSATKTERTRHQQKNGGSFHIDTLRWQGKATIADHAAYQSAVANGIGPAKAYGCGLLLTRPAP